MALISEYLAVVAKLRSKNYREEGRCYRKNGPNICNSVLKSNDFGLFLDSLK